MKKIEMVINGITVRCSLDEAKELLRPTGANRTGEAPRTPVFRSSKEVLQATSTISGDTAPEYIMNVLKAGLVPQGHGLHTVFSGLNGQIRKRFGFDPMDVTSEMAQKGLITVRPAKGGAVIKLA